MTGIIITKHINRLKTETQAFCVSTSLPGLRPKAGMTNNVQAASLFTALPPGSARGSPVDDVPVCLDAELCPVVLVVQVGMFPDIEGHEDPEHGIDVNAFLHPA